MMHVFPGGGVDPADVDAGLAGPPAPAWPPRWAGRPSALPVVAAAVREVEEECGVRLDPATCGCGRTG